MLFSIYIGIAENPLNRYSGVKGKTFLDNQLRMTVSGYL